ncbi:unnamed protein product [Tuber aestivum]|uniref:ATP-dependent DNA helicase PIF1 n=1 Tax=Tuber aestivum TaxID=59557 RepID=A0A292Q3K7_9PEZI|nr:unnamed protein product [Tuber aestivum]
MLRCRTRRQSTLSFPRYLQIVSRLDPPLPICLPFWSRLTPHHNLPPLQQSPRPPSFRYCPNMFSELPPPPPLPPSKRHQFQTAVQTTIPSSQTSKGPQSGNPPKPLSSYNSNRKADTVPALPRANPYQNYKPKESVVRALSNSTAFIENEPPADPVTHQSRYFQPQPASSLSALHDAVYFDEDDFESDGDLNFDDSITITTAPSTASAGAPSLPTQGISLPPPKPISEDIHHGGAPSSSAPVDWSSSPAEHFAKPGGAVFRGSIGRPIAIEEDSEDAVEEPLPKKRKNFPWAGDDSRETANDPDAVASLGRPASPKGRAQLWDSTASAVKKVNRKRLEQKRPYSTSSAADAAPTKTKATKKQKLRLSDEQNHVLDIVTEGSAKGVFFTGSAGTGKSVLLREVIAALREKYRDTRDAVAVTASTGLAACNIGGVTLHSFAGIGLGKEPGDELVKKVRKNAKARNRWLRTKVLVIDEISMVDGDLFDKLERIAREIRMERTTPFGGIQVVITGDFFQLPPVPESGRVAKFAFDADTWPTTIVHTIGLTQVFRQRDPGKFPPNRSIALGSLQMPRAEFANILNEMRLGRLSDPSATFFQKLSRRLRFPTRYEVDTANLLKMKQLSGRSRVFEALDTGTVVDKNMRDKLLNNCMAPQRIELKINSQVMLIKNQDDTLVNGSLGRVVGFMSEADFDVYREDPDSLGSTMAELEHGEDHRPEGSGGPKEMGPIVTANKYPLVQFALPDGTSRQLLVQPEAWKVELPNGEVQAQRIQIPLILAWALSIHKAQGQTLERVKVDLGKVFEKGQAYVALSRATCQEGLEVLRFDRQKVMAHEKVRVFYNSLLSAQQAKERDRERSQLKSPDGPWDCVGHRRKLVTKSFFFFFLSPSRSPDITFFPFSAFFLLLSSLSPF